MLLVLLSIATTNMLLGFALAVVMDRFKVARRAKLVDSAAAPVSHVAEELPVAEPAEQVQWSGYAQHMLDEIGLAGGDPCETAACAQLYTANRVRELLTEYELVSRMNVTNAIDDAAFIREVVAGCERWRELSRELGARLSQDRTTGGAAHLAALSLDYATELEAAMHLLCGESKGDDVRLLGDSRRKATAGLLEMCYTARDTLQEIFSEALREFGESPLPDRFFVDERTQLANRVGFERLFRQTPRGPAQYPCVILIDIDRFHRVNEELSPAGGDIVIDAFTALLDASLSQSAQNFRLCHAGGPTFIALLDSATLSRAELAAECVRQTIEATDFEYGDDHIELTISCGVVQVGHGETASNAMQRLRRALGAARNAGRNRTCVDRGDLHVVQPQQVSVTAQVIHLRQATSGSLAEVMLEAGSSR